MQRAASLSTFRDDESEEELEQDTETLLTTHQEEVGGDRKLSKLLTLLCGGRFKGIIVVRFQA